MTARPRLHPCAQDCTPGQLRSPARGGKIDSAGRLPLLGVGPPVPGGNRSRPASQQIPYTYGSCAGLVSERAPPRSSHLLDHEHRRLVGVVVSLALTRSVLLPRWIVSPTRQFGTTALSVGGSIGAPSAVSSLNRKPANPTPPLRWGRTAAQSIGEPGAIGGSVTKTPGHVL